MRGIWDVRDSQGVGGTGVRQWARIRFAPHWLALKVLDVAGGPGCSDLWLWHGSSFPFQMPSVRQILAEAARSGWWRVRARLGLVDVRW